MATPASSLLDAFKPIIGRAIEKTLNRLLALDPESHEAIAAMDGRRVHLALAAPALSIQIEVRDGRLVIGPPDMANEPDLAVRGTLGGWLSQLPFFRPSAGSGTGSVRITGDAELARQLQRLTERFDPDWNLPFTELFGDVVGVQIATAVRSALRTGRDGAARFARHGAQFLTEESRDVVGRAELDAHLDEVDALRDRLDRLHARVQRLHRAAGATGDPSGRSGIVA